MCRTIYDDKGNAVGVACGRGDHNGRGKDKTPRCAFKPCDRPVVALCDFVLLDGPRQGKTCDLAVCEKHRTAKGPDLDCCWLHRREAVTAAPVLKEVT